MVSSLENGPELVVEGSHFALFVVVVNDTEDINALYGDHQNDHLGEDEAWKSELAHETFLPILSKVNGIVFSI